MRCLHLEDGDEVSDSLLLVLGNALRNPSNVADFLIDCQFRSLHMDTLVAVIPAPSVSSTRTPPPG
jgi:hypothetical protein